MLSSQQYLPSLFVRTFVEKAAESAKQATEKAVANDKKPEEKPKPTIQELEAQIKDIRNRNLFLLAEVENARRRFARLEVEMETYAVSKLAKDLLPVADNMGRIINSGAKQNVKDVIEAVKLVDAEFHNIFKRFKIEKIVSKGQKFDPQYHDAIQMIDTRGSAPSGTIIDCTTEGYKIDKRLLRAAKVIVAK
ncbi:co-chaperone GrpE family protein [Trichomonas vaginalis G3]|uniref:GrpE protein homolog n=1 Tax=Trichomonas vaginalis (strain ATCC PRA-98 / G3) TaxID=412133 RepID=A2DRG0_TRIV3|nr:adenyl-nucleotide exchange factor protein [Trichomonas vaginalis G3]EAY17086.1 co-chaperone GrpE family protein [Trichomonas vaginalis G3]KAI5517958.1 adenyl-nucleotide exchange factor protein [Trichomonas vaginalis G3]|eukprot:XP_001329309.1 co-chaperone GrpE family protein [Trichomonas vaginalis G3]